MIGDFKILLLLKFRKYKRTLINKTLSFIQSLFKWLGNLFILFFLLSISYSSDIILSKIPNTLSTEKIIFQITPIIIFIFSILRLTVMNFDETAINLLKLGKGIKTTVYYHIILNVAHYFSLFLFIFFTIAGLKNIGINESFFTFGLYILELIITIFIGECVVLNFRQYFIDRFTWFYLSIIFLFLFSLWYSIYAFGFAWSIPSIYILPFLIIFATILLVITIFTSYKYLFIDSDNNQNETYSQIKETHPVDKIINHSRKMNKFLKLILFVGGILLFVFVYNILQFPDDMFMVYGLFYFFFFKNQASSLFSSDYKWMGYLHSGIININDYIRTKLKNINLFSLVSISMHLIIYFIFDIEWLDKVIPLLIYWTGIFTYFYCWKDIKFFVPGDSSSNDNLDVKHESNLTIIEMPIMIMPFFFSLLLLGISALFDLNLNVNQSKILYFFSVIGIISFLLHNIWVKKLTQYYKKKRFEIFEKAESI